MRDIKIYKLTIASLLYHCLWFFFVLTVLLLGIMFQKEEVKSFAFNFFIVTLLVSTYILPLISLLYNHWTKSRFTTLIINKKVYELTNGYEKVKFMIQDIDKIIEYKTYSRSPWGHVCYWEFTIGEKKYYISSLLISKSTFDRHFWNRIIEKEVMYPKMK